MTGKLALVSGSTAGIGCAIAERLASEGAEVIVNGRTQERVDAAVAKARSAGAASKLHGLAAEVNALSGVRLSWHYLPLMKQKGWGRVLSISSESALQVPGEMIHYGMTKTAQLAIARGLAETTAGTNVTVNAVLPGPTASEGVSGFVDQLAAAASKTRDRIEKDFFERMRPPSIIKRFEQPAEIADVVAFLASPLSSAINGAAVRAEGGVVRSVG